jgi:acetolactate synthase-1/2/3 large subunit
VPAPDKISDAAIEQIANLLNGDEPALILLGGTISLERMQAAANIAAATGARIVMETFPGKTVHGAGTPVIERIAYLSEWAIEVLKEVRQVILVGATEPVGFFAYPDINSRLLAADCQVHQLASLEQDIDDALARLGKITGTSQAPVHPRVEPAPPTGTLDSNSIAQSIARLLPRDSIVVDEGIIGGIAVFPATDTAEPHEWIMLGGGAIGWGLPAATGAAIACPERKVLCLEGDGSAMYTIQALWTMGREKLDVTTVIFANRQYAILQIEFSRVGADGMGDNAQRQMNIGDPDIDYVALAQGMGVNAIRATTAEEFDSALARCMAEPGPHLIEAIM